MTLLLLGLQAIAKPQTYALLIGISEYQNIRTTPLSSHRDIEILEDALLELEIKPQNIRTLYSKDATKSGITKAWKELNNRINKGDSIYIHYSGHGSRTKDTNNDEEDGWDEVLLPYDTLIKNPKIESFEDENFIPSSVLLDDELGILIKNSETKVGSSGQVFLSFDSCFSGSITRSITPQRGFSASTLTSLSKEEPFGSEETLYISSSGESYVSKEINRAGKNYGILSYYLAKELYSLRNGQTYKGLFQRLDKQIRKASDHSQAPQTAGNTNKTVFNNHFKGYKEHLRIIHLSEDGCTFITRGNAINNKPDTDVFLYPKSFLKNPDISPIAKGTVTEIKKNGKIFVKIDGYPLARTSEEELIVVPVLSPLDRMDVYIDPAIQNINRKELQRKLTLTNQQKYADVIFSNRSNDTIAVSFPSYPSIRFDLKKKELQVPNQLEKILLGYDILNFGQQISVHNPLDIDIEINEKKYDRNNSKKIPMQVGDSIKIVPNRNVEHVLVNIGADFFEQKEFCYSLNSVGELSWDKENVFEYLLLVDNPAFCNQFQPQKKQPQKNSSTRSSREACPTPQVERNAYGFKGKWFFFENVPGK